MIISTGVCFVYMHASNLVTVLREFYLVYFDHIHPLPLFLPYQTNSLPYSLNLMSPFLSSFTCFTALAMQLITMLSRSGKSAKSCLAAVKNYLMITRIQTSYNGYQMSLHLYSTYYWLVYVQKIKWWAERWLDA